nr:MAG TPA: hypothetical protein [Caudoviricetes sp.]
MSRLIDADEFQKQIVGMAILNNYPPDKANALCKLVDSQPTAFDVEKVIEELNKELELADEEKRRCTTENMLQFDEAKGYARGIACAIEIVKRGGRV